MSPPVTIPPPNKPAQATPPVPAPTIVEPPRKLTPTRDVPDSNDYLTPERVAQWDALARDAVVQAALSAQQESNALHLSLVFHEIIEATIYCLLEPEILGSMVRDILAAPTDDIVDPVSTFLDTLSSLLADKRKQSAVREQVQRMLIATEIDISRMRVQLENDLLMNLGMVRDSFGKISIRKATLALYRQMNYNLLREETEGYSKLMTEYFTTVNSQPPNQEVVNETYQRVNALIGAFDLDIGRVLDVTLDVFANLLVKHGRFFVKLLRSSAWWPELRGYGGVEWVEPEISTLPQWAQPDSHLWHYTEEAREEQLELREARDRKFWARVGELGDRAGIQAFFEIGSRKITSNNRPADQTFPPEGVPLSQQQKARKWADDWMAKTNTLPPSGNNIAAQLLGFKLRFYASDARDPSDFLPENLIYLAALLIKIGFISILDLYPHLYPQEEDMAAHRERLLKAKKEKEEKEKGAVGNALTMAGALPDEGLPPAVARLREREADSKSKSESERSSPSKTDDATEKKPKLPEPADQKFTLLKSLLTIGALPEALFILGRHPWMLEAYPELLKLIFRLAHHSLTKVYENAQPRPVEPIDVLSKGAGLRSASRPTDFIPRRTLRWAKPDERDAGDGIDYKFYWEDWVDNVPICHTVDDVIKLCTSLLGLVGPECGQDVLLLTKIVLIGKMSLADDQSDSNRKRWIDFSATFIAPALSFTGKNPGIINEVWDLFKHFDTATRYSIYQQWFSSTKPAMRTAFAKVQSETKHTLSRISATNTKEYGRKIAKISYSSPGTVFQMTLKQLVAYPNMINALVECSRYLTLLGYDCLTWTLVNFFLNPIKGGTQEDGMLSASWLKNIASFVGKAYQKYPFMDPTPVLQFTTHQLLRTEGELFMLDVLEQMIKSMGGISLSGSVSEAMTLALCGGHTLRTFTLQHHLADHRHQAGSSARRLVKCLKDTGLAPQILIALAQHVEAYPHREDQRESPDKVVLFNVDKLRSNLNQYLELLRAYMSASDFDALFPPLVELISDFGVEPDVAFTVARVSIAAKANAFRVERKTQGNKDEDTPMANAEESLSLTSAQVTSVAASDVDMQEAPAPTTGTAGSPTASSRPDAPNPEIESLVSQLQESLPDTFANHPCLSFYVTFWQLSLQDVDDGGIDKQYRDTIAHFERQIPAPVPERRGYNSNIHRKETEEARRAKIEIAKLKEEQSNVINASSIIQDNLRSEMLQWFDGWPMMDTKDAPRSTQLHEKLLQDCFLPRSRMSLQDAQFASSMLKFMHQSGVPGFRTIKLLDLLFRANKLTCIISMYTEDESRTFGRFLGEILRELQVWHENKDGAYEKLALGSTVKLPGLAKSFDASRNPTTWLTHKEFCELLGKWHTALFKALKACIESGNWMQIRNSINVLKALYPSFPKMDTMANELRQTITQLSEVEEREDLKRSLQSILADFTKGERFRVKEHIFLLRDPPPTPPPINGANKTETEKAKTPQPSDTKLNATAPAFEPTSETNGEKGAAENLDGSSRPTTAQERESSKPASKQLPEGGAATPSKQDNEKPRANAKPGPPMHPSSVPARPDHRNAQSQSTAPHRPSHTLPTRPDPQPPRNRHAERAGIDRPPEHGSHGRYDNRGPPNEYGRLDRAADVGRQREPSPGRHMRPHPGGRTPERMQPGPDHREWAARDAREARDYDEWAMRAGRDGRGPPSRPPANWDVRDNRDLRDTRDLPPRDPRERNDARGHGPIPPNEARRMPSTASMSQDYSSRRREPQPGNVRAAPERDDPSSLRPPQAGLQIANDGPPINPARAAIIDQAEYGRHESPRPDRDARRSRPSSPRRPEERRAEGYGDDRRMEDRQSQGYHGRGEPAPRDLREERFVPQANAPANRDRREDFSSTAPSGPRGGRNENAQSGRRSHEVFQEPRSSRNQAQDPNYGRLNQPAESMPPSGPRSDRPHTQGQPAASTTPSGPAASNAAGIHPSRLENIQPIQTNVPTAPSGPRGSNRTPQTAVPISPVGRGPPTGPAAAERGSRNASNPLRAINSVLTQNAPGDRPPERAPYPNPPVRGRGANRASGPPDMSNAMPPPSQMASNPRAEGQHPRSNRIDMPSDRMEGPPQDDGRSESRGHRESRRSEKFGTERTSERSERSSRNGPSDRPAHVEQGGSERDRGREKRGGERESSSRRDREREGERSGREPRESSRRERGSRDEGRLTSGREDREKRSRPSGGVDDGRKRGREPGEQDQGHGEMKRSRRSYNNPQQQQQQQQ